MGPHGLCLLSLPVLLLLPSAAAAATAAVATPATPTSTLPPSYCISSSLVNTGAEISVMTACGAILLQ